MKKLLLILCFSIGIWSIGTAQTSAVSQSMARYLPKEDAIVKDSAGRRYSYDDWVYMVATSRRFSLRPGGRNHPGEFVIYPLYDANGNLIITEAMKRNKPDESEQFHAGDVFKPFNEKDLNGEKFDLKKMSGKVFVINFWFIGCPPCREEIPQLNKLTEHYKDNKDVVFLAICLDKGFRIKEFIKNSPFNYHIIDDGRSLAEQYGVHLYPTHVVVNKSGKVAYSAVSDPISNTYWITKTVDEALQVQ